MLSLFHPSITALAFFQSTQLSLFESFLSQAVSGIDSTSITSGMQNVAYIVLLVGFLWQVYQAALHGGDVRGLGTNLIKYVATATIVMNYHAVFTTINQGFVNAGNWINSASGTSNLLTNWANDLNTQYNQSGFQNLWGMVTGGIAGLLDGLLIIVAYVLYPFVIAIFGFFYILYGSILYIFGPIVIALMPLGATNRLAKSYVENVFIWNAWPVLYGGFGALLSAVQMGQVGQMLNQNNFLGGLGSLEGSILIGLASIIYSLAIAVIPFIAKKIVSGEVGASAGTLIGAAATALTAGIAATEGVAAGIGTSSGSAGTAGQTSSSGSGAPKSSPSPSTGSGQNQPTPPQRVAPATQGAPSVPAPTQGDHIAGTIRGGMSDAMGAPKNKTGEAESPVQGAGENPSKSEPQSKSNAANSADVTPKTSQQNRGRGGHSGPSPALMRPHGLATWGAYHAARLATRGAVGGARALGGAAKDIADGVANPVETAARIGSGAGRLAGAAVNASDKAVEAVAAVANAVANPGEATGAGAEAVTNTARNFAANTASTIRQSTKAVSTSFSDAYGKARSGETPHDNE